MSSAKPVSARRGAVTRPQPARPRRGRPPRADRERLLAAAERAVRRGGPQLSLERIAAAAGVTKPVLFDHVGDRRALVEALAERLLARIEASVAAALAGGREGRAALERVIRAQLETIAGEGHLYAFVNGAGVGEPRLASTLAFARRAAAPLVAAIAESRRLAGQDPAPAEPWGFAIIGALHMVGLWWLDGAGSELPAARLARQLTDLLWSGLAPSPGATAPRSRARRASA